MQEKTKDIQFFYCLGRMFGGCGTDASGRFVGDNNNTTRVHGSCTSHGVAGAANRLSQGTEFANDHNADRRVYYLHLHLPTRSRGHDAFSAFRVACPKRHVASSWEVMVARSAKQVPEVSLMLLPGLVVRNLTYYAWCM
jgi:hypothetical protein